jgi:glycosyltransferase involved in cell wall biosynthesis
MGYDTYGFSELPTLKKTIALIVCQHADVLTAPSASLARLARETGVTRGIDIIPLLGPPTGSADPAHVSAVRQALDVENGTVVCVAVQRHYSVKEPTVFLDAWQLLKRPDCRLVLVGGGELESLLRQRVAELGLDNVTLMGEVPREEVPAYLALADIFLHHSHYESFGLGILEAMEAGLPVIASNVGAVPEIITDGVDGLLVPPSDPPAMAAAVTRLATSPGLRNRLATAARERAREFGWERLVGQYEARYH